jgi:hypothetical protein
MPWVRRVDINVVLRSLPHTQNKSYSLIVVEISKQNTYGLSYIDIQIEKMRGIFTECLLEDKVFSTPKGAVAVKCNA